MLRVLLVSPVDPDVPGDLKFLMGGESTYTKTLLSDPPTNVKYIHYLEALKLGLVEYLPLQFLLGFLVKIRVLPLSGGSQCFKIKGDFDLVHCHGYSVKINGHKVPLVMSDSSSNYLFLRNYVNWPIWRIKSGYFLRRILFGILGVVDCDTNWENTKKIIVFSKFAKKLHQHLGIPSSKLELIYPGLSTPSLRHSGDRAKQGRPDSLIMDSGRTSFARMTIHEVVNILFVGTWFERKGGQLLVEAFEKLSQKYPNIRLTIVGEVPKKFKVQSAKLKVYKYIPRKRLMREFYPKADIFVLVPPKVEGYGFAVVEAMSFGIPVVVSNVCALPELVDDGKTGFVIEPGDVDSLTLTLEKLIRNKNLRTKMGQAAGRRFEERFSIETSNEVLLKTYHQALS